MILQPARLRAHAGSIRDGTVLCAVQSALFRSAPPVRSRPRERRSRMTVAEQIADYQCALVQRRDYLTKRIEAKQAMVPPWDTTWDVRERDATIWALGFVGPLT